MDFTKYPSYSTYRTLQLTSPVMVGFDVYALQTALIKMDYSVGDNGVDGIFGKATETAVKSAQTRLEIYVDGLAGGGTQQAITKRLTNRARVINELPVGLAFGQCMHESSCRLGNYSQARSDGSYDAGVTQMNTSVFSVQTGFNVPEAIEKLGLYLRQRYNKYEGIKIWRRWQLASGAWNAPAWSAYLAKREGSTTVPGGWLPRNAPSAEQIATLEAYMASTTAFMKL